MECEESPPAPREFFRWWYRRTFERLQRWKQELNPELRIEEPEGDDSEMFRKPFEPIIFPEPAPVSQPKTPDQNAVCRLDNFNRNIQHLKHQIVILMEQNRILFTQLFAMEDAIEELKEDMEWSSSPESGESSPDESPINEAQGTQSTTKRSTSFVRHYVTYPASGTNRRRKAAAVVPHHAGQGSYDSGIQTSDQEIFV